MSMYEYDRLLIGILEEVGDNPIFYSEPEFYNKEAEVFDDILYDYFTSPDWIQTEHVKQKHKQIFVFQSTIDTEYTHTIFVNYISEDTYQEFKQIIEDSRWNATGNRYGEW